MDGSVGGFGGQIHPEHPFVPPEDERDPVRRLRGRLPAPVTLWTAVAAGRAHGLTVASVLVAEPSTILGVLDEDVDLFAAIESAGRFAVAVLDHPLRALADAFAFVVPAPGGPFAGQRWRETDWGPVPATASSWAGCVLRATRPVGYGALVEGEIEHVRAGDEADPLVWHRGRYRHLRP